jgi:low affinity Fe/Cu permease
MSEAGAERRKLDKHALLKRVSDGVMALAGKPEVFFSVCAFILLWIVTVPFFGFDGLWYSIIQAIATIVTLLMVFIIQDSHNRDTATLHLKLDELIRANSAAKNELLDLEHLTREQLDKIIARYKDLAASAPAGKPAAEQAIDEALSRAKSR